MRVPGSQESQPPRVRLVIKDGVARLTLTRADKHNAIDPQMLDELLAALSQTSRNKDVRAVIVDAEGPTFCAGVDLQTSFFMEDVNESSAFTGMNLLDAQHELIEAIYRLPQVTIAALQGNAVGGGGFGLAMACDLRFAVRDSTFWMVPGALNVVQDFGLTWLLQRAIGPSRTIEMVFTGRRVDAETAEHWGFVNQVFETVDQLCLHVDEVSSAAASTSPDASKLLKHVVRHGADSSLEDQLKLEAIANGLCFQSADFREAKTRFMDSLRRKDA